MSSRAAAAALLILALLPPACGSPGDGAPPPSTAVAAEDALASYVRSGGVAGSRFQIVVRPDGRFEGGAGKLARGHLGAASLEELRGLVAAFAAAAPAPTYGTATPDGFSTSVTAGGASTALLGDADPPPAVSRLVSFLAGLGRQLPR